VTALMAMPSAEGLFQRAGAQIGCMLRGTGSATSADGSRLIIGLVRTAQIRKGPASIRRACAESTPDRRRRG
jgi:hypothetical protein